MSMVVSLNYYMSVVSQQNGTVVIENPDMLKAKYSNGHSESPTSAAEKMKIIMKGPTDKQVNPWTNLS